MLKKGQKAKSIEKSQERNKTSTYARFKLLERSIKVPKNATQAILDACKSQASLANWEVPTDGIYRMSLNTLKSTADLVIEDGGWEELNRLRQQLRDLSKQLKNRKSQAPHYTKQAKIEKGKEQQKIIDEGSRTRFLLILAYSDAMTMLRNIAKKDTTVANLIQRHFAKFGTDLGIRVIKGGKRDGD